MATKTTTRRRAKTVKRITRATKSGLRPSVFLKAILDIESHDKKGGSRPACFALTVAVGEAGICSSPERTFFERVLKPVGYSSNVAWYGGASDYQPEHLTRNFYKNTARIMGLALCGILIDEGWES